MKVNIALLGAGRIGQVHARAIVGNPDATLLAVADAFEPAARAIAGAHGSVVREIDEIAASDDIDAVLICTPTATHADLIETFARSGKVIFCEKPIDLDIGRVTDCLKVVEETRAKLMIGFNRRFDPHFLALKSEIATGRIGNIEMINIISRDPGPPPADYIKSSGGIFKDMTIHDFDMARFLLDEEFETVFAAASVLVDPAIGKLGDFDSASIVLTSRSGRQCTISNSRRASYGYDQRIEVLGSRGAISAGNQRPVDIEIATRAGYTRPPLHDFFMSRYEAAYGAEIDALVAMVRDNAEPAPTGHDGLIALKIAEAAGISAREKRLVLLDEV